MSRQKNKKICVVCGRSFYCSPSRNIVTCGPDCRAEYTRQNHTGIKYNQKTREKMAISRLNNDRYKEMQEAATRAAQNSPKSGKFAENVHAIDWHLISPDGKHYYFHSLSFWLRENCRELFGVEPDSREFDNIRSGLSGVKRAILGGKYGSSTYKGWQALPVSIKDSEIIKYMGSDLSVLDDSHRTIFADYLSHIPCKKISEKYNLNIHTVYRRIRESKKLIDTGSILTDQEKKDKKIYYQEYYQKNKDTIKKRSKEYHQNHRDECIKSMKSWYENHKEEVKKSNRIRNQEYYQKNRDKILSKRREQSHKSPGE